MIRNTSELYKQFPWMTDYPNMALYVLQFGMDDLIAIPWVAKDIQSAEKIYGECVKAGKDWRTYLHIEQKEGEIW